MRKIFPLAASCPPTSLIPYCLKRCLTSFSESVPSGASTVVIAALGAFEYSSSPSACIPARAPLVSREAGRKALLAEHLQRLVQPFHQRDGRRPGRLVLPLVVALALQVEVEAGQVGRLVQLPRLLAGGEERQAGREAE